MLKLFCEVEKGTAFHFYDKPERVLIRSNGSHYISPEGRRKIHPHVLVFQEKSEADNEIKLFNKFED
jgi:hypothetical protein